MNNDGGAARRKTEIAVTMSLAHDELFSGAVFLNDGERLIDLLNDDRAFIPVRRDDGATVIVAKSNIVSIIERAPPDDESAAEKDDESDAKEQAGEAERPRRAPFDPYKVLRISADATIDEVRRAYKARMKAVHPDTLAGLELDDEIQKAAMTAAQRVNIAYNRILRERRSGETDIAGESAA